MKMAILLVALSLLFAGCATNSSTNANTTKEGNNMATKTQTKIVANGDTVQVDYVGKLENGAVFDTSLKAEAAKAGLPLRPSYSPLEFTVGAGQMIAGFDAGVVGMSEGQEKTVKITPENGYGNRREDMVVVIPIENIGNSAEVKVGSMLSSSNGATGVVTEIKNGTAKVDFNHELAGKNLVFTIKMVKITKAA
jgi:FKBP-type peptidyl-prolyl cis-trans isomerase 2